MDIAARRIIGIVSGAAALAVWGHFWLKGADAGINVLLCLVLALGLIAALKRRDTIAFRGDGGWLAAPALLAAAGFSVRDSPTLTALDSLALGTALLLGAHFSRAGRMAEKGVLEYLRAMLVAGIGTAFGAAPLLRRDVPWANFPHAQTRSQRGFAVGRGLLLSVPLLLVFGGLFSSADPVFAHLVAAAFQWDFGTLWAHAVWIGVAMWLLCGFLRHSLLTEQEDNSQPAEPRFALGPIETVIVLGALDALFLAFVLVQARYFFGGRETVLTTVGMTYAEYARHGFFELVTVAALTLPLLLTLHAGQMRQSARAQRPFRTLATLLLVLLFVVMASALGRMSLYRAAYGLTELRVYTTAFMGWLAVVFVWFAATVLQGKRPRFAIGALALAFAGVSALHLWNPDGQIVRANAKLARSGHVFDADYALSLSADAVPELIRQLPALPAAQQRMMAARLLRRWSPPTRPEWRSWCWGRAMAWQAVQDNRARLTALSPPPAPPSPVTQTQTTGVIAVPSTRAN